MLAFKYRFHGHGSLRYVYKNGDVIRNHLYTLKYTRNKARRNPRVAVVVSKKVHKGAVGRNRIRRRVFEIVRQELPLIGVYDIVIIVSSNELLSLSSEDLKKSIRDSFSQTGLYI